MIKSAMLTVASAIVCVGLFAQEPTACGTMLESIEGASLDALSKEYVRLKSYQNPYCDTTNSDYHKLMKEMASQLKSGGADAETIVAYLGEPYYRGSLAEYENQKVRVGRGGQMIGKALPPQFKIPAGEYYVVYLWREKDYLVFALKGGSCTDFTWWEKGNYR